MVNKEEVLKGLKDTVLAYNKDKCLALAKEGINAKINPLDMIQQALTPAIRELGNKFGKGEIALPYLMVGAEIMQATLSYLISSIPKGQYKPKAIMVLVQLREISTI